jgi:benzodiazapine receptor
VRRTALYTAMGVASWRVWRAGGGPLPLSLYAAQLALNFLWSPIFFKKHNLKLASADITGACGAPAAFWVGA